MKKIIGIFVSCLIVLNGCINVKEEKNNKELSKLKNDVIKKDQELITMQGNLEQLQIKLDQYNSICGLEQNTWDNMAEKLKSEVPELAFLLDVNDMKEIQSVTFQSAYKTLIIKEPDLLNYIKESFVLKSIQDSNPSPIVSDSIPYTITIESKNHKYLFQTYFENVVKYTDSNNKLVTITLNGNMESIGDALLINPFSNEGSSLYSQMESSSLLYIAQGQNTYFTTTHIPYTVHTLYSILSKSNKVNDLITNTDELQYELIYYNRGSKITVSIYKNGLIINDSKSTTKYSIKEIDILEITSAFSAG